MPGICVNEDIAHFYANHPEDEMTAAGCDGLVDFYARFPGVTQLLFCANVQRALFDSRVWEPVYHGYDPEAGPDQPALRFLEDPADRELTLGSQGRYWIHNLWLLKERGVDHLTRWLTRCRQRGIEGWLSVRMNDGHFLHLPDAFWHPTVWRERPDLWIVPHDQTGGGRAWDYTHREVREHHLALIRELLERYDPCGLELDWIRGYPYFPAGTEAERGRYLTELTAEVRELATAAAARLGHPVKVGARVPTRIESGRLLGMDGLTWAREGLVDQLVLSSRVVGIEFDVPVDQWRRALGSLPVTLAVQFGTNTAAYPAARQHGAVALAQATPELLRGAAGAAFHAGADQVYLFNHCYYESEPGRRDWYCRILESIGSLQSLAGRPRRHAVTYPEISAPGEPDGAVLPARIGNGERARFALCVAPLPDLAWAAVVVGFERGRPSPTPREIEVRVNGQLCRYLAVVPPGEPPLDLPAMVDPRMTFLIPRGAVVLGSNTVEIACTRGEGEVVWCEIRVA